MRGSFLCVVRVAALSLCLHLEAAPTPGATPPPARYRQEVEAVLALAPKSPPTNELRPLELVLVANRKDHGSEEHDYPLWMDRWKVLLGGKKADSEQVNLYGPASAEGPPPGAPKVTVQIAQDWPTPEQWSRADLVVAFFGTGGIWNEAKLRDLKAFLDRGGGFVAGDKRSVSPAMLQDALDAGITFAAIHYRFVDGEKTIFPVPQHDGARAVQFIRSQAEEWNIDPVRIACFGGSAGAGISMWIGFHDDLAQPDSPDPVARPSTRIRAVGTMGGQGTYDPVKINELIGGRAHEHPSLLKVYGLKSVEEALDPTPEIQKLYDEAAAITHLTKDDPPLYMVYSEPDIVPPADAKPGQFIHHPNFGRQLKAKMDELGIENLFINGGGNPPTPQPPGGMLEFLKKHLLK